MLRRQLEIRSETEKRGTESQSRFPRGCFGKTHVPLCCVCRTSRGRVVPGLAPSRGSVTASQLLLLPLLRALQVPGARCLQGRLAGSCWRVLRTPGRDLTR